MKILGLLMTTVGLLIAGLAGLCSMSAGGADWILSMSVSALVFGLMLIAGGVVLLRQPPR